MKKIFISGLSVFLSLAITFSIVAINASAAGSTISNVVVFVKFKSDTSDSFNSGSNWENIKAYYNDTSELHKNIGVEDDYSFKNYINLISRGAVNIQNYFPQDNSSTVNVLELNYSYGHYTEDYTLIREVMDRFNDGTLTLPSGKLDNVEAGFMDCLTIIIQTDSHDHPEDTVIYPHKSLLGANELVNNKYIVNGYILMDSASVISGMRTGVITHEFMHIMGFPDLYRGSGSGNPVGVWDIMASVGNYKQYPLSYMRALHGWVPLRETTTGGSFTLDATTLNTDNAVLKIKTPMSDSEFFCVEYRKKKTEGVVAGLGIETKIPSSGLLVYRVNDAVENHSNFAGNDYLYIFRPDDTSTTSSAGTIYGAAINPAEGETSYGSADFNAPLSDNTIFFSSGKNSGIVINNVTVSADGNSVTFDVEYPDYTQLNLWDKVGNSFGSSLAGDISTDIAPNGDIYAALLKMGDWNTSTQLYKYDGTTWAELGTAVNNAFDAKVKYFDGSVYYAYCNSSGYPVIRKYTNGTWTTIATITSANYPMSLNFFADDNNLFFTYAKDSNQIVINKVGTNSITLVNDSLKTSNSFANFTATTYNGKFYALYSIFAFGSSADKNAHLDEYDPNTGTWTHVQDFALQNANTHCLTVSDSKLYAMSALSGKKPLLSVFDGESWSQETVDLTTVNYTGLKLDVVGDEPYIVYASSENIYIDKRGENGWETLGEITNSCSYFDFHFLGGRAYVPTVSTANSNATVFTKVLWTEPMTISSATNVVATGKTLQLTAKGGSGSYTWKSNDTRSLTVSSSGLVKGISQGGATVTATDADGNTATYFVKVTPSNDTIYVYVVGGKQQQKVPWWKRYSDYKIRLAYQPYGCEDAVKFKWTSSNPQVSVSTTGIVTNYSIFSRSSTITMTAYDKDNNVVAKGTIKVLFYKLDNQLDSFKI